jgi:lambda family phage minor tail protein L
MTVPVNDLVGSSPDSLIELFQLKLDPVLHAGAYVAPGIKYFYSGVNQDTTTSKIKWDGVDYDALPIIVEGIEYKVKGSLPRPTLRVSNLFGFMTNIINAVNNYIDPETDERNLGQDLAEARLTRIRTLVKYIDADNWQNNTNPYGTPSPTTKFSDEVYFINRKVVENQEMVEFELRSILDFTHLKLPKRQVLKTEFPSVGDFV